MVNGELLALAKQAGSRNTTHTVESFKQALVDNLYHMRGQGAYTASPNDVYMALAYTIRDILSERFRRTIDRYVEQRPRFVYYLSAEYLPGQQITQNLLYTGMTEVARQALKELNWDLDRLIELETEPALGNGGLGRLAACFFDSMANLNIPSVSYGINYEFGIFQQSFMDGWQVESPDEWLYYGNPWVFTQTDNRVTVGFGGCTEHNVDENGRYTVRWVPATTLLGEPSHMFVPGQQNETVNMLRLWRGRASKEFDFQLFDVGDYARAAEQKIYSENISKVLYPNDNTPQGRELRLKQEYFFAACSLRDIIRRFLSFENQWQRFPEKLVIQLNDTHPVVVIPEMMRLLVDEYRLGWDEAWSITTRSFAYTCHTLMPEALEKWPVGLFESLLPRHLEIVYEINQRFLAEVAARFPGDDDRLRRISIIEEGPEKLVRMAHLASVGCFSINGVAELHTELLKKTVLHDFYEMWPEKFNNKTNGVSPRRFVQIANPRLTRLLNETIGESWQRSLEDLSLLEAYAGQADFRAAWQNVKRANKLALAAVIARKTGAAVDPTSMYDVMVKRLHEYKRQMLKALHIVALYNRILADPDLDIFPRTFIFGAKAAPGYREAKLIIKLINSIAETINKDPLVKDRLKVAFLPNLNVTLGEKIYPAAELSEQISLAGKEASGTGNMKFALNGALTIGTLDGANVEIRRLVGPENFYLFGLSAEEVAEIKAQGYQPNDWYRRSPELAAALDTISRGVFYRSDPGLFQPLIDALFVRDEYMIMADFPSYLAVQDQVDRDYRDRDDWTRRSILNTARSGHFSSDRTVQQYSEEIWKVKPVN